MQQEFVAATRRALACGYEWLELHSAHGYLSHEFLSPLTNQRTDQFGGSFDNRIRFLLETATATREAVAHAKIPVAPGYQVSFAERIRKESEIATAAVGLINEPKLADQIVRSGQADLVYLARELLRDPYWPARAAKALDQKKALSPPNQYARAW